MMMTIKDFIKAIEEAEKIVPERPTITVKNAKVTGVKLNSKMIDSIPKAKEPVINFYEGLKVYQDDSLKKPQFIVEGEIETKKYLKWEDLEFTNEEQTMKVKLNNNIYTMFYYSDEVCFDTVSIAGVFIDCCNKQFFNDLHLEVVE